MAWVELKFEILGEVQVARAFQISGEKARDMREPLGGVGDSILDTVGRQFDTEGAYGGTPWKRLNSAYEAWKREHFPDMGILVRTRTMRETMQSRASLHVYPQLLVYLPAGPHADIASYHQGGAGDLPRRRIVEIPDPVKRSWERIFLEWIRADVLFPGSLAR